MNTHEYLVELAKREKTAALQARMRGMSPGELVKFAQQRGVDLTKLSGARGAAIGAGAGGLAGFLTDMAVNAGNPVRRTVQEMAEYGPGTDGIIRRTIDLKPQIQNLGASGNRNVPARIFYGVDDLPPKYTTEALTGGGAALGAGIGHLIERSRKPVSPGVEALGEKIKAILSGVHMGEKRAQASFLGSVLNTGSGLLRNLGVARAGLQTAGRLTGNRGIGFTIGSLITNPQSSGAFTKALSGGFGDFGRGAFSQAAKAGRAAFQPGGSLTGVGQQFLGATEQLANSVNRFGRKAFGTKSYQRMMAQQGFKVPGRGTAIWETLNRPIGAGTGALTRPRGWFS